MVGWHHWLNGHEFEQTLGDNGHRGAWCAIQSVRSQRVGYDLATEQQQQKGCFQSINHINYSQFSADREANDYWEVLVVVQLLIHVWLFATPWTGRGNLFFRRISYYLITLLSVSICIHMNKSGSLVKIGDTVIHRHNGFKTDVINMVGHNIKVLECFKIIWITILVILNIFIVPII